MKIAIDARFYGTGHTGLGRYTTNVLKYLPKYLPGHTLQILLKDTEYDTFPEGKNIEKIHAEIPHYSLAEQIKLPILLNRLKPDLLYTFHFNTPILSKIPTIVTIHDLIKSRFTGKDTTTHSTWLYALKRLGYNLDITHALTTSRDIIVPSNTVKNDILGAYPSIRPELIHAISEAPDEIFRQHPSKTELDLPKRYLLFVGNAYPHKNLKLLLDAFRTLKDPDLFLVIVAKRTPFLSRTLAPYDPSRIVVYSELSDQELISVYHQAEALVTPSLMEGYGLVGIEALMQGVRVVASNIPVYREVYQDKVTFFDPTSLTSLVTALKESLKHDKPKPLQFARTWDDVAQRISEVINARSTRLWSPKQTGGSRASPHRIR